MVDGTSVARIREIPLSSTTSTKIPKLFANIKHWIPSLVMMSNTLFNVIALKSMGLLMKEMLSTISADIPIQFVNFALQHLCEA